MRWARLAADQGHAVGQCYLGMLYANGLGVPHDVRAAVSWLERSARQYHFPASMSLLELKGMGVAEAAAALKRLNSGGGAARR